MAAKNLNRLRPQDAPQLTAEMILNRRMTVRRSTTTQGVLADVPLPGLVALAHFFSKQLRTTIAVLQSCVEDERVVIALDRADRDKAFMETYLSQFSASIGEILQFARLHDISNRRFQFQTLSEAVVRNDIDVRRNRLYAVCDVFVRRTVAHHLGIDSVAKGVHAIMFDCAWAATGDACESLPPQRQAFAPVVDDAYAGLRLHAEEYARLDHVVAFSMVHLGADVCAQYELGVTESDSGRGADACRRVLVGAEAGGELHIIALREQPSVDPIDLCADRCAVSGIAARDVVQHAVARAQRRQPQQKSASAVFELGQDGVGLAWS
jgi:hypothetical protein